jgi:hypothetical protein
MADGSTTNADSVSNINDAQPTWQEQLANVQNILRDERERRLCEAHENQARSTCDGGESREGENDQSHDRHDREQLSQRLAQLVKAREQARVQREADREAGERTSNLSLPSEAPTFPRPR